jgi:hypothetical protein
MPDPADAQQLPADLPAIACDSEIAKIAATVMESST